MPLQTEGSVRRATCAQPVAQLAAHNGPSPFATHCRRARPWWSRARGAAMPGRGSRLRRHTASERHTGPATTNNSQRQLHQVVRRALNAYAILVGPRKQGSRVVIRASSSHLHVGGSSVRHTRRRRQQPAAFGQQQQPAQGCDGSSIRQPAAFGWRVEPAQQPTAGPFPHKLTCTWPRCGCTGAELGQAHWCPPAAL